MAYKHGVSAIEQVTAVQQVQSKSNLPFFVVTAPSNLASDPRINEPVLCYTMGEVYKYLGYSTDSNYTSNEVVDVFFTLFKISPICFVNVLDPTVHKTDIAAKAFALTNNDYTETITGIIPSTVVVKAGVTTYVKDTDYYQTFTSDGYIKITKKTGSAMPVSGLTIAYSKLNPSAVVSTDIIGGIDLVTGLPEGLELVDSVFTRFRVRPTMLSAPKYSASSDVAVVLKTKASKLNTAHDCMAICDLPDEISYIDAPATKTSLAINNPIQLATFGYGTLNSKRYRLSIALAAQMCQVDIDNNDCPCESPSNKVMPFDGACYVKGGKQIPLTLTEEQGNYLGSNGIITIINQPHGIVAWGNQTAAYPANTDLKDTTINWKRLMQYYKSMFIDSLAIAVDKKVTKRFIESKVTTFNQKFNAEVIKENILSGKISYNSTDNPQADVLTGSIKFRISLGYSPNAQDIGGIFELDVDAIKKIA